MKSRFLVILLLLIGVQNPLVTLAQKPIIKKPLTVGNKRESTPKKKKVRKRHKFVPKTHHNRGNRRSSSKQSYTPFNPSTFLSYHRPPNSIPSKADSSFLNKYSKLLRVQLDSSTNTKLIAYASAWLGCPYRFGGNSKLGTDCSGFVSSLFREVFNLNLSHGGASMLKQMSQIIKRGMPLKEGDILFFRHGKGISHVAMYLKDHKFIHAATHSRGVVVDDLRDPYFARTFTVAGRPAIPNPSVTGF
jgi:lipoprotein Spr/probable lipoprotein NlpC